MFPIFPWFSSILNLEDEEANRTDSSTKVDGRISAIAEEPDVDGWMTLIAEEPKSMEGCR